MRRNIIGSTSSLSIISAFILVAVAVVAVAESTPCYGPGTPVSFCPQPNPVTCPPPPGQSGGYDCSNIVSGAAYLATCASPATTKQGQVNPTPWQTFQCTTTVRSCTPITPDQVPNPTTGCYDGSTTISYGTSCQPTGNSCPGTGGGGNPG